MKKLIITMSNCEISVKPKHVKAETINLSCHDQMCVTMDRKIIDNMEFLIFGNTRHESNTPFVINLTKQKLEVELLRKQVNK